MAKEETNRVKRCECGCDCNDYCDCGCEECDC